MICYREKYPLDWKVSDHTRSAGYLIEWLKAQGNKDAHDLSNLISGWAQQFTTQEWTIKDMSKIRLQRTYWKRLTEKTRAFVDSRAFFCRTTYWDPIKKTITGTRFKVSEKYIALLCPKVLDPAFIVNSVVRMGSRNHVDLNLDIFNKRKFKDYPQWLPPNCPYFDDMPETLTDVACFGNCPKSSDRKMIWVTYFLPKYFLDKVQRGVE
jgi:hypothetical protein